MKKIILTAAAASLAIMFAAAGTASASRPARPTIKPCPDNKRTDEDCPRAVAQQARPSTIRAQPGPRPAMPNSAPMQNIRMRRCWRNASIGEVIQPKPQFLAAGDHLISGGIPAFARRFPSGVRSGSASDHLQRLARARRREHPVEFGELISSLRSMPALARFSCHPFRTR
jgi:hypothetical protein